MHQPILSFSAGEVSPYLRHRVDLEKATSSCEVLRNFLPLPYGAAVKRPGLVSLRAIQQSDVDYLAGENQKMLPFTSSTGVKYLLHFTETNLKIYRAADGTLAATKAFMTGYEWPDSPWENGIRALHYAPINDVAFITHPGTFPLRLSRITDTEWHLEFIPFERAPMLDGNLKKFRTFTVASDPVAPDWTSGEDYVAGDTAFTNCEWKCILDHTASAGKKPGTGADWREYWQRNFYQEGDPVTLLADDREQVAWTELYQTYVVGHIGRYNGDSDMVCILNHTMDETYSGLDFFDHVARNYDSPTSTGSPTTWARIWNWVDGEGTAGSYSTGMLCHHNGTIYRSILGSGGNVESNPDSEPGIGADWTTYWEVHTPTGAASSDFPDPVSEILVSGEYQSGQKVSRKGRVYECTVDHVPDSTNRPGSGVDWEDFWVEVSRMVEEFSLSDFSPGQYFRISPERDEQDFQLEIIAGGMSVDVTTTSEYMAVQGDWNFFTYGTWWGTFKLQRSSNNGATWETIRSWQASGDRNIADNGSEDSPVLLRLKFTKEDGGGTEDFNADSPPRGLLIPALPYVTGYCLMDTYVSADEMTGTATTAMLSGNTWQWAEGAFNARDGFPRALALHESRLVFAGTAARPVSLWFSQADDLINFETGTDADQGIYATLALTNASPIRWLASQRRLFVGTAFGEWVVGSETSDQAVTPTNFMARQYTGYGSHGAQPVIALDSTFFMERRGTRLRELSYFSDRESYDALDLSLLAEHLFRDGIASMAWQQTREPALWIVTRGGALLCLSYNRLQRIQAWSRHDSADGLFRDVAVIPSDDGDDEVFFMIDRDEEQTHLERFPQHWLAAIENEDSPVTTDTDGDLPITAEITSLPIDFSSQDGTTQARRKRLHKVSLSLYHSAGGVIWNASESSAQMIGDGTTITTGWVDVVPDSGHLDELQFHLKHNAALPFILRAVTLRFQVHEK